MTNPQADAGFSGAVKLGTHDIALFRAWSERLYPDPRSRPPLRELATLVFRAGLEVAQAKVHPAPTPLEQLAALTGGVTNDRQ